MLRVRSLTAAQQATGLRALWQGSRVKVGRTSKVRRGQVRAAEYLIATGEISATPITEAYLVRIEYRQNELPKVFVEKPALSRRPEDPDIPIPHTYDSDKPGHERPCIFLPGKDWDATKPLGKTLVPWLRCWLLDYEAWRASGKWSGGGAPHPLPK
jgi:hypothetical protein